MFALMSPSVIISSSILVTGVCVAAIVCLIEVKLTYLAHQGGHTALQADFALIHSDKCCALHAIAPHHHTGLTDVCVCVSHSCECICDSQ